MTADPNEDMLPAKTQANAMEAIRQEWGTRGTLHKIMHHVQTDLSPITVRSLLDAGPNIPGYGALIAAMCFTSIAKLKEQGCINISKDPITLEILDISLSLEKLS